MVIDAGQIHPATLGPKLDQFKSALFKELIDVSSVQEVKGVGHELETSLKKTSPVVVVVKIEGQESAWPDPMAKLFEGAFGIVKIAVASPRS